MKIRYFYSLFFLLLFSCENINKSDPIVVAETIEKGLQDNSFQVLEKVFGDDLNYLNNHSKENMKRLLEIFKEKNNVRGVLINSNDHEKTDKNIEVFFTTGEEFYSTKTYYNYNDANEIQPFDFYFTNLSYSCNSIQKITYAPQDKIEFKRIIWSFDDFQQVFRNGAVELKNNTDSRIDFIKFQISLKQGSNADLSRQFFNKTIEYHEPIPRGDIIQIQLKNLENFYTGFNVNPDNLFFETRLIEVKPKPISYYCLKVNELKEAVNRMKLYQKEE